MLLVVGRITRRLLPLAALLKLSLVFPDEAPSRFRVAMRSGTVETLRERIAAARSGRPGETPIEAAQRLLTLVAALDVHDALTRGHSDRVRAYSQMIGKELGLSRRDLDLLNWAALLHDVGKLDVPIETLQKPGRPSEDEWLLLRRHPQLGAELVAPLAGWLGEWAEAVPQHHERWDGRGYPAGKVGDQIALAGRIVAVADVFDVMTSARSYKEAGDALAARHELSRYAGSQFDPRVVRAFLNVSLGRLRFAMGPLSWLAHAPLLGRIPLTPLGSAVGSVSGSLAVVAAATTTGIVGGPELPASPLRTPAAVAAPIEQAVDEPGSRRRARPAPAPTAFAYVSLARSVSPASTLVVRLPGIGADHVVRITEPPTVGAAHIGPDNELVYRSPADFVGTIIVRYRACTVDGRCTWGTVRIEVRDIDVRPRASTESSKPLQDASEPTELPVADRDPDDRKSTEPSTEAARTNHAPTAVDDLADAVVGRALTIDLLANDSDRDRDVLELVALGKPGNGNLELLSGGRIRYTPGPSTRGTISFPYTVSDPSRATSRATVFIRVTSPAAVPSFRIGREVTVLENAGTVTLSGWATEISDGSADGGTVVSFLVEIEDTGLFAASGLPALAPDGTLTFTPKRDASGQTRVVVRLRTEGTAGNGGMDASAPQTSTIHVLPVNSAPTFTPGGNPAVGEDSGPFSESGWATAIDPGAGETSQTVSFLVANDNPDLFVAGKQPAVSAGALTFTPAPNAHGVAHVTVRAKDDGGNEHGGTDTGEAQALTITVTPVADAPAAAADTAATVEDSAGVTFDVLANDIDADQDQLTLTAFDSASLSKGALVHSGGGTFTYIPSSSANGLETFAYTVSDGHGGTSTAAVTISIAAQPDAPSAAGDAYVTSQDVPLGIGTPGLLANDSDEDGDAISVKLTGVTPPTNGALVLSADGSFTYTPNPGFSGTDSFDYKITDGSLTDIGTATITVSAIPVVPGTFYFTPTGGPDIWGLSTTPPLPASPEPDYESDGNPGLTIEHSGGQLSVPLGDDRRREWVYAIVTPLVLNGPVTAELWSTIAYFRTNRDSHPYIYLFDCAAGGTGCVLLAENDIHVDDWNSGPTWMQHLFTVGSVSRTIAAGRELRLRLLVKHEDLWIAMTANRPSALHVTLG